jgi:hypothetical protein
MRILVSGHAHGGTTWLAGGIAAAPGVHWVNEPDNRAISPFAGAAMQGLRIAPWVKPGERLPKYELVWDVAFRAGWPAGRIERLLSNAHSPPGIAKRWLQLAVVKAARFRRPSAEHQLVKSVLAHSALEWIADRYDPRMIVVWRSPLNRLASMLERGWDGGFAEPSIRDLLVGTSVWPVPRSDKTMEAMWTVCAQLTIVLDTVRRHPDWLVVRHEDLAAEPIAGFRAVYSWLGLEWSTATDDFLERSEGVGSLDEFRRVASNERDVWSRRLSAEQVTAATAVLARFAELETVGETFARCLEETSR